MRLFRQIFVILLIVILLSMVGLPGGRQTVADVSAQVATRFRSIQVDHDLNVDGTTTLTGIDVNGNTFTIDADGDTTLAAVTDDIPILTLGGASGYLNIATGNLKVGNGTPSVTLNGEDAYVEGTFEVDGSVNLASTVDALADVDVGTFLNLSQQTAISLTEGAIITPTGTVQPLTSAAAVTSSTTTPIETTGIETGDLLIIRNDNASDVITIDGTGGTVECKSDVALGASDTVTLIFNGTAWNCLANYDNS